MFFTNLTNKEKRIIREDIGILFSMKGYLEQPTFDELKSLPRIPPSIKHKEGMIFLSEIGIEAMNRMVDLLAAQVKNLLSMHDIHEAIVTNIEKLLSQNLAPDDVSEFISILESYLVEYVKSYTFLVRFEGLKLADLQKVNFGHMQILKSDPSIIEGLRLSEFTNSEKVSDFFDGHLWLMGEEEGSRGVARDRFGYHATLVEGILGIFGSIQYRGAIWRSRVRAVTSAVGFSNTILSLSWSGDNQDVSLTRDWGSEQELVFKEEDFSYFVKDCFFNELCFLMRKSDRTEIEQAIIRSVYWFAEAYRDRNPLMQFIKLWSSVESFFAMGDKDVTENNAKGIASVLTFGDYRIIKPDNYLDFKKDIKHLYQLRSKAIHRAEFTHVKKTDVTNFSYWVAWLIISMVGLSRKCQLISDLHNQVERLDKRMRQVAGRCETEV